MSTILEARHIGIQFGGLRAVDDFNLDLQQGELVAIIGPNGAGKTTCFNMLTGIYKPTTGDILLEGQSILNRKPHEVCNIGIARTFQNIRLFGHLSVLDNVKVAMKEKATYGIFDAMFRTSRFHREEKMIQDESIRLLSLFNMEDVMERQASNLPYGEQRKLEIVRALATNPKILFLDEPAAGMNGPEIEDVMTVINDVRSKFDITILLIEHHMNMVMNISDRIKVLSFGRTIAEGKPDEIRADEAVIEAYLGKGDDGDEAEG